MTRWYEDIEIDEAFPLGEHTFTAAEIIRFAQLYDPQYFHTDPEAAKHSHFDGLIASGWHTASVGHRKMVDALSAEAERLESIGEKPGIPGPSPGINRMDFTNPVRPGDTVRYQLTVTQKRPSKSLPGWGVLHQRIEAHKTSGDIVYVAELVGFIKMRDYKPPFNVRLVMWAMTVPGLKQLLKRQ